MDVIATKGLTKSYGERVGIRDVDLSVPEGSVFGFIGPNGAGKSTTIRLLLGFLHASRGAAEVFGLDCWSRSAEIKRDVGYVPGDLRLHSWLNGRLALDFVSGARGLDLRASGCELAEFFDLDLEVEVRDMSRGMRQKLGLILALAHRPRLLVLDEPTSGLDPLTQDRLYRKLREAAADGRTVFFSSHVLSEVQDLCDQVAIIRAGELIACEPLAALRARALRAVRVVFRDAVPDPDRAPSCLRVADRNGREWRGDLEGTAAPLLAWLRDHEVVDVSIESPDLDSLFKRYYQEEAV